MAHIGAIEELESRGFEIAAVAGTSMGALVGGMYAAGHLDSFREWFCTLDRYKVFSLMDFSLSAEGFVKGDRVIRAMEELIPDVRIEQMPLPYAAVAADLLTGREVVIDRGGLYDAIRASISIPSVFRPVRRDGMVLIDGGTVNPLPLNRVRRTEGDLLGGGGRLCAVCRRSRTAGRRLAQLLQAPHRLVADHAAAHRAAYVPPDAARSADRAAGRQLRHV